MPGPIVILPVSFADLIALIFSRPPRAFRLFAMTSSSVSAEANGEASAAPDVADAAGTEQGSDDRGVQDVARPQPRQLEWADQAAFLTLRSEVRSERARDIQAVAEQGGGGRGLGFDGLRHGFT